MLKPRQPDSLEAAIQVAVGILGGSDAAGAIVRRSGALVLKWSDPDCEQHQMPEWAGLALDRACKAHAGQTPIHDYRARCLDAVGAPAPERVSVTDAMLTATGAVGDLARTVHDAVDPAGPGAVDPAGPGGVSLTVAERSEIADGARRLRGEIDRIEHAVGDAATDGDARAAIRLAATPKSKVAS